MSHLRRTLLIFLGLLLFIPTGLCADTIIDFESLNDGDLVTNQYPGLTFSNTIVLSAGISLNEFEFPPHSGTNVVSDNGGPMTITFFPPIQSFSGYFTYSVPLKV